MLSRAPYRPISAIIIRYKRSVLKSYKFQISSDTRIFPSTPNLCTRQHQHTPVQPTHQNRPNIVVNSIHCQLNRSPELGPAMTYDCEVCFPEEVINVPRKANPRGSSLGPALACSCVSGVFPELAESCDQTNPRDPRLEPALASAPHYVLRPRSCELCSSQENLTPCANCLVTYYCSEERKFSS